jgi:hypothetical protein
MNRRLANQRKKSIPCACIASPPPARLHQQLRPARRWSVAAAATRPALSATISSHVPCRQHTQQHLNARSQSFTVNAMSASNRLSESGRSDRFSEVKPVTDAFSVRQLLYVFLLQGVGASAVCFGINFGVAVLVFRGQPPPTLFEFPLPLAGNFGIIIAVEVLLNCIISGSLQTLDVLKGICPPIKPSALGSLWPKRDSPLQ